MHQAGCPLLKCDNDNNITPADVMKAAFKENGAMDQFGKRYFNDLYFD
jgi:hypothetical protein